MKYIITENRLNNPIKNFILTSYPIIHEVFFTTSNRILGSTEGRPTIEVTTIHIILDNSDNNLVIRELENISKEIVKTVNRFFILNHRSYGSKWEFQISQLSITPIYGY